MARINILLFTFIVLTSVGATAGTLTSNLTISETDSVRNRQYAFFDLRERETYLQLTNTSEGSQVVHIQIFNVDNNCNENDFFDTYTGNDTHIYNLRDIISNDGNPSGVVLPDNSYGIVAFISVEFGFLGNADLIGNLRVVDSSGYEYRINMAGRFSVSQTTGGEGPFNIPNYTFNFNKESGITFSEVIGITLNDVEGDCTRAEVCASDPTRAFIAFDVDIFNNNEVPFSCRNVIFSCIDEENPRQEELLELVGVSSIARFEYGINNAVPHTKGGELLCPGNIIDEGFVTLQTVSQPAVVDTAVFVNFVGFVGLNNGNDRGSLDMVWVFNQDSNPIPP